MPFGGGHPPLDAAPAAGRDDLVLGLDMDCVGAGGLAGVAGAAGGPAVRTPGARGGKAAYEAFEIALLLGREVAGHRDLTPPAARRARGRTRDRPGGGQPPPRRRWARG